MEYVQGQALNKYLEDRRQLLSVEEANEIFLPLMESLANIHAKGIVHRDISPDNIIIRPDGSAKLIDFGAARYSTGEMSKSLDVILKHGFAPKEQYIRRSRQGLFTDVYALAATYYFAVTGKIPPDALERLDEDPFIPPSKLGVKIDRKTEEALLKALAVDSQNRFRSMEEFRQALIRKKAGLSRPKTDSSRNAPAEKRKTAQPPSGPKKKKTVSPGAGIALLLLCAVLLSAAVFAVLRSGRDDGVQGGSQEENSGDGTALQTDREAESSTVFSLICGYAENENGMLAPALTSWKDYLETESGGRISINLYSDEMFSDEMKLAELVRIGQNTAMCVTQDVLGVLVPEIAVLETPLCIRSEYEYDLLVQDEAFYGSMAEWFAVQGYQLVDTGMRDFRVLTTNKEVNSLSDLGGLKLRTIDSPVPMHLWQDLGTAALQIPASDLYTALEMEILDAQEGPLQSVYEMQLYEQQQYLIETNHQPIAAFLVVNKDWYDTLPQDLRAVVDDSRGVFSTALEEAYYLRTETVKVEMKNAGITIVAPSDALVQEMRNAAVENAWTYMESIEPKATALYREALARAGLER